MFLLLFDKPFNPPHTDSCSSTNMAGCCCNGSFLGSPAVGRRPSSGFDRHPSDPAETQDDSFSHLTGEARPAAASGGN